MKRSGRLKRRVPLRQSGLASKRPPAGSTVKSRVSTFKPSRGGYTALDAAWRATVLEAQGNRCRWPGERCDGGERPDGFVCETGLRLTVHHGVRRGVKKWRHDPRNGLVLCLAHHHDADHVDPAEWKAKPCLLADSWVEAGGWFQNGELVTPGEWWRINDVQR